MQSLCNGDFDAPLRIDVWDRDSDGSHDSMGSASTSLRQILSLGEVKIADQKGLPVIETKTKKGGKTKTKNSGNLYINGAGIFKYDVSKFCEPKALLPCKSAPLCMA